MEVSLIGPDQVNGIDIDQGLVIVALEVGEIVLYVVFSFPEEVKSSF